jgi:hypothetical protein
MERNTATPDQNTSPMPRGASGPIGAVQIKEAEETLQKYRAGKVSLESRIIENEQWYRLHHWDYIRKTKTNAAGEEVAANTSDPEPTSARLFNVIFNAHADAMDNFPTQTALPHEASDETEAKMITDILPVQLEQIDYEEVYSDVYMSKIKSGTGITAQLWDNDKLGGLGDVNITEVDILNIFWEPGIGHIQKSRNVFYVSLVDNDILADLYPHAKNALKSQTLPLSEYIHDDNIDQSNKSLVIDWYYRKRNRQGKKVLHYCKFCNGVVLYATENDTEAATDDMGAPVGLPMSERGWYDDAVYPGRYPFTFDVLFKIKGSPAGFGLIDICRSPQIYIDKLDQAILKTAIKAAKRRPIIRDNGGINEKEYTDLSKDVIHYSGSGSPAENIMFEPLSEVPAICENIRLNKIDEMNDTTGNREWSQGGTTAGVTAASAIAALIETGGKTRRLINKGSYRAHRERIYMVIERNRQFYTEARYFRITGEGQTQYASYNNQNIAMYTPQGEDIGKRVPIFDIKVVAQKASPFSTAAQNERAKEFFSAGFFNPQMADQALAALEMMDFEGIDKVKHRIEQNGTMLQIIQQITPMVLMMAQELDAFKGTQYLSQVAQILGRFMPQQQGTPGATKGESTVGSLGNVLSSGGSSAAQGSRVQAASTTAPRA